MTLIGCKVQAFIQRLLEEEVTELLVVPSRGVEPGDVGRVGRDPILRVPSSGAGTTS